MRAWLGGLLLSFSLLAQTPDFTTDVKPIFARRCAGCHGAAQQMSGLRLDNGPAILAGGNSGPAVVAGQPASSKLLERVSSAKPGFQMPPMGARLSADEIATIRRWIEQGAKVPAGAVARSSHWSFQPIRRPAVPSDKTNPIDAFVHARLKQENIAPSPEADRHTLIRRLSFDLTGLPPTPAEVESFIADKRPDAYERLVDRLLASPHYGEKWARFWLDLAHYADSDGYEKDQVRPIAWRYRHWVIQALNADMPFDRFTIDQLAGDLVPAPTTDQRVATGFLRNTLTNREGGVDPTEARFEQLINRTNTVSTTWMGLTMGCSQCHNHKYDPITQRDYYSMLAYFENTDEQDVPAPLPGESEPYKKALPDYLVKRQAVIDEFHVQLRFEAWQKRLRQAFQHQGDDLEWDFAVTAFRGMVDGGERFLAGGIDVLEPRLRDLLLDYFVANPGPDISNKDKPAQEELKKAREKLTALQKALPPYSFAPAMTQMADSKPSHIHIGGDYKNVGEEVPTGTPAFLPAPVHGSRLDLARWLVSRDNPLTARVTVNRIWQELFGRGLVQTSEDFGTQGEKPSHPELLDWLASEFMDHGWSVKSIQRQILLSATYRQSSHIRPELQERDPENVLLARQSRVRLPAELVRDAALASSGLLNNEIGGHSVRPPQPAGVAELGYANSVKWKEDPGSARYRRGLYIHYQRTTPYPLLANFDAPEATVSCSRRRRSNTPLQALNLLNDPVFVEAAQALGKKHDLDTMFELALGRKPRAEERARLARYVDAQGDSAAAWTGVGRILFNLDEFMTRE